MQSPVKSIASNHLKSQRRRNEASNVLWISQFGIVSAFSWFGATALANCNRATLCRTAIWQVRSNSSKFIRFSCKCQHFPLFNEQWIGVLSFSNGWLKNQLSGHDNCCAISFLSHFLFNLEIETSKRLLCKRRIEMRVQLLLLFVFFGNYNWNDPFFSAKPIFSSCQFKQKYSDRRRHRACVNRNGS